MLTWFGIISEATEVPVQISELVPEFQVAKIELALQTRLGFGLLDKKIQSGHERNKNSLSVKVGPQDFS